MAESRTNLSLNELPDEILQQIILFVPPLDIFWRVQRLSKKFNRLGCEYLLWRHHCRKEFKYWDPKHQIHQKFLGNVGDVDWKAIYARRKSMDTKTTETLNSILSGQIQRIGKFGVIGEFGYDAKDTLLRHCNASDDEDDVLARRYYASAVLDHVHRAIALEEWHNVAIGYSDSMERALGAFDLFVLHDQRGDLIEISEMVDNLAANFRTEYPDLDDFTTRQKALAVASYLRAHNLTGNEGGIAYRDLQNNYIGIALQDPNHPSLPLISVAIFCALASRIGLDARFCGMPNHISAMVHPEHSKTLDGRDAEGRDDAGPMFLDPYRSDKEVPASHLRETLTSWGIDPSEFHRYMGEASATSLVLRTSRNILATVQEFRGRARTANNIGHPSIKLHGNPFADMDTAFYSSLWANFLLSNPIARAEGGPQQTQFIPMILERFERLYPMDTTFIQKYVCPVLNSRQLAGAEQFELTEALRVVQLADQSPKQVHSRKGLSSPERVKYKVGQVIRHKRYAYTAVITGWDLECGMEEEWILHNDVDGLPNARRQSFYHALVEDTSLRYVAEDSIEIIRPDFPTSLMGIAGQYFKRWDKEAHVFVSNIRDEYPED